MDSKILVEIEVELLGSRPEAMYQGTVYDQSVVVRLPDGSRMGLFDKDVLVDEDLVGQETNLVISLLSNSEDVVRGIDQKGIESNQENPGGWNDHIYHGEVTEVLEETESSYKVRFDVGYGDVIVYLDREQFDDPPLGDFLQITATRSDIYRVSDHAN